MPLEDSSAMEAAMCSAVGHLVQDLIGRLIASGIAPREIFLISPFRVVVRRLRQIAQQVHGIQVGTIHTAQGKESDVVILVLGGNPSKPGAKKWASQRPNLLNVAASRAKRRLYVVGNRDDWRKYPYFSDSAALLATE
jgi:superfamily I DNA and/or RNA helicase